MKIRTIIIIILFLLLPHNVTVQGQDIYNVKKTITFSSEDSLAITADSYIAHNLTAPFIILFHQAGWSRGEYKEIAPILNSMGFNCIAIDQRSGDKINNVLNQTHKRAVIKNKSTAYLDAYKDMIAALKFVKDKFAKGKIIIWGSSYSAALVFKLAAEHQNLINGVLAFSPGEYFVRFGKSKTFIADFAKTITLPVFITSAHNEKENWINIYKSLPSEKKQYFVPQTNGNHGSRALWKKFDDSKDYWKAVSKFLKEYFL